MNEYNLFIKKYTMTKPEEFNNKLEELKNNYNELYEMFDYLNNSRDEYIEKNEDLKKYNTSRKRLSIYLFICWFIEFILFLVAINL